MAKLKKPAQVGNTVFSVGVSERAVIERAQREYDYQHSPEAVEERRKRLNNFLRRVKGKTP
jgi:uncharacterized protein YqiB (DUF1249 family)